MALWTSALLIALNLRFDFRIPADQAIDLAVWLPVLLAARVASFHALGLFRGLWRYTGAPDLVALVQATTVGTLLFSVFLFAGFEGFPRSVPAIEWLTAITLVGGLRFATRALRRRLHTAGQERRQRVLVIGAGDAGETLLREIHARQERWDAVGVLDDSPHKRGAQIHGVRVVGTIEDLPTVAADFAVDEVLIAVPSATGAQMRRMVAACKAAGVRFRTIPGIGDLIDGRVTVSQLREVAIEDLLGRDPVQLDMAAISEVMAGRVVMVSGAGGSIGSELCRQVCRFGPERLVLVEHGENNLFQIHRELQERFPDLSLVACIADVGDEVRMHKVFAEHRPDVVLHAAAHKHVPMMEWNPGEAVKNNVFGTKTLADLSDQYGVDRFVMISTDKAVNPTSVMGVSKRVAEIYVQGLSQRSRTRFVTVRFGNVLGSTGSVIPIFKEQIAAGGPVTVTHPEMQRYFMTIPEASQLVLQAGSMGAGGEIFILDMGEPVKISDLARDLISLCGYEPGVDIEIEYTGVRPGEKLFEELSVHSENAAKTRHPKIFVGRFRPHAWEPLLRHVSELGALSDAAPDDIRRKFAEIVPEFRPTLPCDTPLPSDPRPANNRLQPGESLPPLAWDPPLKVIATR
ncbi:MULTISPECIES: polysaccharide biosynthesis protein [Anaeromyxobacter]|uniref:polysaccharide biosynthesis protein n=1 Tax=Anaeromyxobacter TaxID=161492 RepID=UPI001F5A8AB3|nr:MULTISPECIES: nucleoside-diphosphate sugar epimerase/dehydratase [unclassified Anaeromyxobacter]